MGVTGLSQSSHRKLYSNHILRRSKLFFLLRDGDSNTMCLCSADDLDAKPTVVIDPVDFHPGENWEIAYWNFSDCERYLAFTLSLNGSDREVLHIYDFDSGKVIGQLHELRFASIAWDPDSRGFLYNRYFPPSGKDFLGGYAIFHHALDSNQIEDTLVQDWRHLLDVIPEPKRRFRSPACFIFARIGTSFKNYLAWRPSESSDPFKIIHDFGIASTIPFKETVREGYIEALCISNLAHDKNFVASLALYGDEQHDIEKWTVAIPESNAEVLDNLAVSDRHIFCVYNTGTSHRLRIIDRDTSAVWAVPLPESIELQVYLSHPQSNKAYVFLSSAVEDRSLLVIDPFTQSVRYCRNGKNDTLNVTNVIEHAICDDGVSVPISLVFKSDVNIKDAPLLLYVYGGFGLSSTPSFDPLVKHWLEHNGIFAIAHVRGGGEFGTAWHDAGRGTKKQRAISDLITCAQHLAKTGFGRPHSVALHGASHGGFLVAATLNQCPTLFNAAVIEVPVTDLMRYETDFTGLDWKAEFGSVYEPEQRPSMIAISPLHNITNQTYPPILIMSADCDDRVVPWHSTKYAAMLRAKSPQTDVYMVMRKDSGHSRSSAGEEEALILSFLYAHTNGS